MSNGSIYGEYRQAMEAVMAEMAGYIEARSREHEAEHGDKLYEHLNCRIKGEDSMREKLSTRGLAPTPRNALREVTDAIGLRVVCLFIDDVYAIVDHIRAFPGCTVVREKDYIRSAKPNGYRSYHMILDVPSNERDIDGHTPGHYFVEVQLRTIAMDTWAALEHELKYKKHIMSPDLIARELHRCANELAACDVSMQTLRQIIRKL